MKGILIQELVINLYNMKLSAEKLNNITGGTTISGTIINAFTNIIKTLKEAGMGLGSSIRRITDNAICPLK